MKKRLLSAFLALSMLFSIMPTTFATQTGADGSPNIDGTPNIIKFAELDINEDGTVSNFNVTTHDAFVGTSKNMFALVLCNEDWCRYIKASNTWASTAEGVTGVVKALDAVNGSVISSATGYNQTTFRLSNYRFRAPQNSVEKSKTYQMELYTGSGSFAGTPFIAGNTSTTVAGNGTGMNKFVVPSPSTSGTYYGYPVKGDATSKWQDGQEVEVVVVIAQSNFSLTNTDKLDNMFVGTATHKLGTASHIVFGGTSENVVIDGVDAVVSGIAAGDTVASASVTATASPADAKLGTPSVDFGTTDTRFQAGKTYTATVKVAPGLLSEWPADAGDVATTIDAKDKATTTATNAFEDSSLTFYKTFTPDWTEISSVDVTFPTPADGDAPSSHTAATTSTSGVSLGTVTWKDSSGNAVTTFRKGQTYTATVQADPNDPVTTKFASSVAVTGNATTTPVTPTNSSTHAANYVELTREYTIPDNTPYIVAATVDITAPVKGATRTTTAAITNANNTAENNGTANIAWDQAMVGTNQFAGNTTYKATLTLTAADNGAEFKAGFGTADVTAKNGGTVEKVTVAADKKSAEIVIAFPTTAARKAISVVVTPSNLNTYVVEGSAVSGYSPTLTSVVVNYDDGSNVSYAGFSAATASGTNLSLVYGSGHTALTGNFAKSHANQNVAFQYTGSDADNTLYSNDFDTLGVYLTNASVTEIATPVAGALSTDNAYKTISDAVSTDSAYYNPVAVSGASVTWASTDDTTFATDKKFKYGKTYTATINVQTTTGYSFTTGTVPSGTAAATLTEGSDTHSTPDITVVPKRITYTESFTITNLTIAGSDSMDYYDAAPTATVTVGNLATGDTISGVKLGSTTLATADYTVSGGTITIKKSAMDKYLGSNHPKTLPTTAAAATKLAVNVTTTAGGTVTGTTTAGYVGMYNTTPYLEVTATTNGKIAVDNGIRTAANTANTYALTKGTTYTVTATGDDVDHPFSGWTGGTLSGTTNPATFSAAAGQTYTVGANFAADSKSFTVTKTGTGSFVVKNGSGTAITGSTSGFTTTYTVTPSQGPFTIEATPTDATKLTVLGTKTPVTAKGDSITSIAYASLETNYPVTFVDKVLPDWKTGSTAVNATHQLTMSRTDFVYMAEDTADYTYSSRSFSKGGSSVSDLGSYAATDNKTTLTPTVLDGLSAGTYTVTYTFTDNLYSSDTSKNKTITRDFVITAAPKVESVTLPTKTHGDNLGTFAFTISSNSVNTVYTYTASSNSWTKKEGSAAAVAITTADLPNATVNVVNGSINKQTAMPLTSFIDTYVKTGTMVRRNTLSGSTDSTLRHGDSIAVGLKGAYCTGASLTVNKKPITLTVTGNNNFVKTYDGTKNVTDTLTLATTDTKVGSDNVNFTDNTQMGVTGQYASANASTSAQTVTFTVTPNTTTNPDLDNYAITATATTGTINKRPITIAASKFNGQISSAAYNTKPTSQSGTLTGVKDADLSSGSLATTDATAGISIAFKYSYDDTTGTDVTIDEAKCEPNYAITVTDKATGSRQERTVSSIVITPKKQGGADTTSFYSSDKIDAKIVVNFTDGVDPGTYDTIDDAKAAGVTVTWSDGTAIASGDALTVKNHNGKTIKATNKGKTGNSAALTVNKIPVKVTVNANKIEKVYDSDNTFNSSTDTVDPDFSYALSVDSAQIAAGSTAADYSTTGITGTGATVTFAQSNVYHATYGSGATTYDDVAKATNGTISNTEEYTVTSTVSNIKEAEITPFPLTIKQIDYIKSVYVGSAGTYTGIAARKRTVTAESNSGYEAEATFNETMPGANDKVQLNITYEYNDTTTQTADNRADVTLHSITLAAASASNQNANYSFTDVTGTNNIPGKGTVKDRPVGSITLTLPTAFHKNASGNAIETYGTAPYDFKAADYAGLTVVVNYTDGGTTTYSWEDNGGTLQWKVTEESASAWQSDFKKVPFTLTWSGGIAKNVDSTEAILWTTNKSVSTMTATIGTKSSSKTVTVNPKEITVAAGHDKPVKNYDKSTSIVPAGTWTWTPDDTSVDSTLTVGLKSGKSVTYSSANASANDIDLRFDGKAYNAGNLTASFDITVDGDTDGSRAGSYKITQITGTTKGTINKRPITLEAINNIKSVNQFSNPVDTSGSAASNATGTNPKSVFAAAGGDDNAGTGTGILSGDAITVNYKAKYNDTSVAGTVTEAATTALTSSNLQLTDVAQANTNYNITNATGPFARTGNITAAKVNKIEITAPSMFGKTTSEVQYDDIFSYDGLAVALTYPTATETYTPKTYAADGTIASWDKTIGTNTTTVTSVPFDLAWTGTSYVEGDSLKVDLTGADKLKATLKSDVSAETGVSSATTTTGLVVGKRRVVPTPATTGVTKTYDGNTTYATSHGTITYTVAADTATSYTPASYALPTGLTVASASYVYDNLNASHATRTGATKINITGMTLGGVDNASDNYVLTKTDGNVPATITKRDVTITQIDRIAAINQGSAISKVTNYAVTTNSTASPRATVDTATPVATRGATPDILELVVDYTYSSSAVAGNNTIAVTIENLKAKPNSDTDQNYNVSGDPNGLGTVSAVAVTLTVTNPTILDANYTFGTALDLAGLKVNVKYGTTGTGTDYTWQSDGSWSDGTTGYAYADLPFTLAYTGVKGGASTTITDGVQLPPANYNGSKITATLKQKDSSGTNPTGNGAAITVKKKPIANIDANLATDDISKVYNRNTTLSTADLAKLSYNVTASEFVTGYEETFKVAATPAYDSKDAANDINISFTGAGFAAGETSQNYEFASTVTVNEKVAGAAKNIEGDITKATITVTDVNVPSITVDGSITADYDVVVINRGSAATASASNVAATGIIPEEASHIQFDYTIVYRQADANGTSNVKTDLFVTLKDQSAHVTATAAANNVKLENYDVVWTPVETRSTNSAGKASVLQYTLADGNRGDYLLGQVADDTYTLISITANVPEHTHGDKLDLRGLEITIKSKENYKDNTTFVIDGDPGEQHWKNNNSGSVVDALPIGVTVELNGYDLSSTDSLDKLQAHHINMNGKNFVLAASPVEAGTDGSKTAGPITVKKKELTYSYDPSDNLDKYYDSNNEVTQTITYTPTADDIVTFAKTSYTDVVTIKETSTPTYAGANVLLVGNTVSPQAITFYIAVDGADKDNYNITAPTDATGKIMPRTVVVTSFNENRAADAIYQDSSTATGSITAHGSLTATTGKDYKFEALAAEGTWPTGLAAPDIKIDYDYGSKVNTIADPVAIPVTKDSDNSLFTVAFNPTTINFTLQNEVEELAGRVKTAGITKIEIAKTNTAYTYGDKLSVTENLDDLNIKLYGGSKVIADFNYSDGTKVNDYMSDYNLKLEILNNSVAYADLLKSGAGTIQVIEDTTGGAVSNAIDLTIAKRKLLVQSTDSIDKVYDGDNKVTSTVTLNVAEDTVQSGKSVANDPANQYGLIAEDKALRDAPSARTNEDAFTVTNPATMTYASKNASATAQVITPAGNAAITPVEGLTIDMDQYTPVIDDLEGIISPKEVELTPDIKGNILAEETGSIDGALPVVTGILHTVKVDDNKAFVSGEQGKYNLTYTIDISDTERQNVGDKTFAPQDASAANAYASDAAVTDSKYGWQITSTDATNYPLTNYTFTWNDAKFRVKADADYITDIEITGPGKTEYEHLDKLDLDGTVITVTYYDGRVVEYTYNSSNTWDVKETVGDSTDEKDAVDAPEDITITWADTTTVVAYKADMGYLDTDKGYTEDDGKQKTCLTATADLTKGPGSTDKASDSGDDILVSKKVLKLSTSGFVEKVYDGNATVGTTADIHDSQANKFEVAVLDKDGNAISGISFDMTNAIQDGIMSFVSTTEDEANEDAGENKKIAIDLTNIGTYLLGTMYTDNAGAFELPTLADEDNNATGKINGQAVLVIKISGTAKKVFDTHDTLVKIADDDENTYDLTIELLGSDGVVQTLTDGEVDALVANSAITYKDLREGTPDGYAGTNQKDNPDEAEKTLEVDLTEFAKHVTLTEDVDASYDLPTSGNVNIAADAVIEITPRPITLVATKESISLLQVTDAMKEAGTHEKTLGSSEYTVYDGQHSTVPGDEDDTYDITGVTVTWTITYDFSDVTWTGEEQVMTIDWGEDVDGNAVPHTLTEAPAANYKPYWLADEAKVKSVGDTYIRIITPPAAKDAIYGEPTDWTDFEFEVSKNGAKTKHKWDKDAEDWVVDGDYSKPTEGTTFKWNDEDPVTDKPPVDAKLKVGDNVVTITDPEITDPASSDPITADKKELIVVVGEYSRPYDGSKTVNTNDPDSDPEAIVITLDGIVGNDDVTFTKRPELNFTDKDVALDADGNVIAKEIEVTDGGILDDESAKNYIVKLGTVKHEDGTETKIEKKQLTVKIKDAGTSTSNTAGTVSRTGVHFSENLGAGKYTIENVDEATKQLITTENVTLSYTGTYPLPMNGGTDQVITLQPANMATVDGVNAKNYEIAYAEATGDVSVPSAPSGGGGIANKLTLHYEKSEGVPGDEVELLEAMKGDAPVDLIGKFAVKLKDPTLTWTSANPEVATVDENGIVTFVGKGETVITAVSVQNKSLKDTVKVIVDEIEVSPTPTPTPKPIESLLTKDMLNPYIIGYDDYVFGPELPISREELAAIFARLIANNIYMDKDYDTSFPDVPITWSRTYIGYLEGFNVVTGYEDGTFRPHNYITRAEMAVMMAKAEGYDISGYLSADELAFPDVDDGYSTWAVKAIKILTDRGIMEGYTDGTFRPGQPITRAETVATVNRVLYGMEVVDFEVLPSDVTDAHWAYNDIVFAMNHRVLKDVAADPDRFIWSEQFDQNMTTVTEKVSGGMVYPSEDNSSGGDEPPEDDKENDAGTSE